jgi:nucleoside 2-deoxyribosyltransferase
MAANRRPKVYLAGPDVFLPNAKDVGAAKKARCAAYGLDGVFPLDLDLNLAGLDQRAASARIYAACETLMRRCDVCLANATPFRGVSIDAGTAFEMGFMRALGKPVFAYTSAAGDYAARARAWRAAGLTLPFDGDRPEVEIEDFGAVENLMIAEPPRQSGAAFRPASHGDRARIDDLTAFDTCLAEVARALRTAG